jgi:hypothetical protein
MIGTGGPSQKPHAGLGGSPVAFFIVATIAGANEVFPAVSPAHMFGNNMVNGHGSPGGTAVTTGVTVAGNNIFSCQENLLPRRFYISVQPDNGRQGKRSENRPDSIPVAGFNHLRFTHIEKEKSPPGRTDGERLIILIQDEDILG